MTAPAATRRGRARRSGAPVPDGRTQHLAWLSMVEPSGPFLTVPVLRRVWPTLDALEPEARDALRAAHDAWRTDPDDEATTRAWVLFVLRELLGWADDVETDPDELARLTVAVDEYDVQLAPAFALVEPGERVKPDTCRLLGFIGPPGSVPTARTKGDSWAATPADRLAYLCRAHDVELGLATGGRWWTLVWAPRGGVTTTATFDAVTWTEHADRDLVRAFRSLLCRRRFFAVPDDETLVALLRQSVDNQEEVTEALGTQVRQAVELLVEAIGRDDARARESGRPGLGDVSAHDVYRGAVAVMMRVVFLLFAEERGLLPADNDLYAQAYSGGRLAEELDRRARETSEEQLEHSTAGWLRLLALFAAVHSGVRHPRLTLPAYDGSIFNPEQFPWLAGVRVDDRTLLHMLRAVQYVVIKRERRRLSFRALDVEEIGYVYEGLLSFEGRRATDTVVGLAGKAGLEEEVPLAELEAHAAATSSTVELAARLAEAYKDSGIGTPTALARRLAPPGEADQAEAQRNLLAATGGDLALAQRLQPFVGVIRTDLRGLPVVITRDSLYVTESRLRRTTGTHYTPRRLAEQVAVGALEPLVYSPGPLQTADRNEWKPRSSQEILSLKVADIAMGSGAFLVAACRYLAQRLIEARARAGDEAAWQVHNREYGQQRATVDAEADPVVIDARREIIEHCLYGVDINAMAVEMAKLSLWLVSMDPDRPFTFLDDRLVAGDSLLGITSLEQYECLHLDPAAGRRLHEGVLFDPTVRALAVHAARQRSQIAELPDDSAGLAQKRRLLAEVEEKTAEARRYADLVVGAALATAGKSQRVRDDAALEAAQLAALSHRDSADDTAKADATRRRWLSTDLPPGSPPREPLHWRLVFPEVFENSGFDAVIGNPPFLGGKKISGSLGSAYREHLVNVIGRGVKGHADLVAYFVLRAHELLNGSGQTGLIATNTLAQGDTREVGLDQIIAAGNEIRAAVKSEQWPSRSAVLQYCAVWSSKAPVAGSASRQLEGSEVRAITPSLDPESRPTGNPERLVANRELAFIGSYILGLGFTVSLDEAHELITKDPRNAEVLFPYLNGEDLNQRPDSSARRWVVNFHDWTAERARTYQEPWHIVETLVRPERQRRKPDGTFALRRPLPERYWHYADKRPMLYRTIAGLERVIVITRVSKVVMPVIVPTGQVINERIVVFVSDKPALLALLSSAPHYWWAIQNSSTMRADLMYAPTDVFETLARPERTDEMRRLGERLDSYRRDSVMLPRQAGLTATYNLVHDKTCTDSDIAELRRIHVDIDHAVMRAYGWEELDLDHGFHETRQGVRYTVGPVARQEILDRLLELNHERYAAEVAAGRHDKKGAKKQAARRTAEPAGQEGLFDA
jgi:hypothetical protein